MNLAAQDAALPPPDEVKMLVMEHQVCWEFRPLRRVDRRTGAPYRLHQLELLGTHHEPTRTPGPGSQSPPPRRGQTSMVVSKSSQRRGNARQETQIATQAVRNCTTSTTASAP